jgi:hypothetical protein
MSLLMDKIEGVEQIVRQAVKPVLPTESRSAANEAET